jgi:hypothetical protein
MKKLRWIELISVGIVVIVISAVIWVRPEMPAMRGAALVGLPLSLVRMV